MSRSQPPYDLKGVSKGEVYLHHHTYMITYDMVNDNKTVEELTQGASSPLYVQQREK